MNSNFKLKDVLKREIRMRGLTTYQLSQIVGIPNTTIKNWLEGGAVSAKNIPKLKNLASFFQMDISTLLFNTPPDNHSNAEILFQSHFSADNNIYKLTIEKINDSSN